MNRPTAAQHARIQADHARRYAETQSLRREFRADAREPVKHLRVVPAAPMPKSEVSQTRVSVYFLIAAAFIFAARYAGVFQ